VLIGSFPFAVYGAMLVATVAGQFLGIAVDALAIGRHVLWVPLAFSLLLEAVVGARFGASRVGHPLTAPERARLSTYYSVGLVALSVPLAGWIVASKAAPGQQLFAGGDSSLRDVSVSFALVLAAAIIYTALRFALMTLFTRRRAP
jgi:hypothetical protein